MAIREASPSFSVVVLALGTFPQSARTSLQLRNKPFWNFGDLRALTIYCALSGGGFVNVADC
jgi:hypothetical protein